jgi:hypothetical protein
MAQRIRKKAGVRGLRAKVSGIKNTGARFISGVGILQLFPLIKKLVENG